MTAEEYVVKKLQDLEEEVSLLERANASYRHEAEECESKLSFVLGLIESGEDYGGKKKYHLSVYEAFDGEDYKRLAEIMEGEKF